MKVLVLLLLSLQGYAEGNCGQDKGFRIINNADAYQLQLCTSTGTSINFTSFDESKLCFYCNKTTERPGKAINIYNQPHYTNYISQIVIHPMCV